MKIAAHLTEKVMFRWPVGYWVELIHKLTKAGHDIYCFSDEYTVDIKDNNPRLHNRLHLSDEDSEKEIAKCDVFIGPPLKYYDMAKRNGLELVGLLAATLNGEGVKSTTQCAGCLDNLQGMIDCLWKDEICLLEITPNDVMNHLSKLRPSPRNEAPAHISA